MACGMVEWSIGGNGRMAGMAGMAGMAERQKEWQNGSGHVGTILFGGSSKEGIMAGTPEGLAEFGQWSNSTMEYYYSGPPRAIHLSWIDI